MTDKPSRDEQANVAARAIIEAEKQKQAAKTARLKEGRLAKYAADILAHAPGEPRAKAVKTKGKRVAGEGFHAVSIQDHLAEPTLRVDLEQLCKQAKR